MNCKVTYEMKLKDIAQSLAPYLVIVLSLIVLLPVNSWVMSNKTKVPDTLYIQCEKDIGVDGNLLKAIAQVESGGHPYQVNLSDPSWGLMQVLCVPGPTGKCENDFPALGDTWKNITVRDLLESRTNLYIAARILKWNLEHYGYPRGIAVYNCWSARKDPIDGPFRNQEYVDKVMNKLNEKANQN